MSVRVTYEEAKLLKEAARRNDANKLLQQADFRARWKVWLRVFGSFHLFVNLPVLLTFFIWSKPIAGIVCLYMWLVLTLVGAFVIFLLSQRWDTVGATLRKEYERLERKHASRSRRSQS